MRPESFRDHFSLYSQAAWREFLATIIAIYAVRTLETEVTRRRGIYAAQKARKDVRRRAFHPLAELQHLHWLLTQELQPRKPGPRPKQKAKPRLSGRPMKYYPWYAIGLLAQLNAAREGLKRQGRRARNVDAFELILGKNIPSRSPRDRRERAQQLAARVPELRERARQPVPPLGDAEWEILDITEQLDGSAIVKWAPRLKKSLRK